MVRCPRAVYSLGGRPSEMATPCTILERFERIFVDFDPVFNQKQKSRKILKKGVDKWELV